jgi:RHS repeat-associated protein
VVNVGEQIYWDGDEPLFTVNLSGALDDIKVDGFAVYSATHSQIAILDRDFSGTQVSQHGPAGYDQWGPQDPYHQGCSGSPEVAGSSGYTSVTETVSQPGTDGIYYGGNTFQGARAYDPVAQQWTAPDAYAGDVHDPMSQKAYMWNRNNPLQYEDPSGYDYATLNERPAAFFNWHSFVEVFSDDGKLKERFSFGPLHDDWRATLGPLVRQPGSYDSTWSRGANGGASVQVMHCEGSACQKAEHAAHLAAAAISNAHLRYGADNNNSNSAGFTICSALAGANSCNKANQKMKHWTAGWGQNLAPSQRKPTH